MAQNRSPQNFSKLLYYILGRRPDEFGLVPDINGFVKIKELLQAINEEDGWGYVRRSHINEVMITIPDNPIEIEDSMIRAVDREQIEKPQITNNIPKLLYTCIRKRSYPHVHQKGLSPQGKDHIILFSDKETAIKIGKRNTANPVLLSVMTDEAIKKGAMFYQVGEKIFIEKYIHQDCFTGPPLPQENEIKKPKKEKKQPSLHNPTPGSFFIEINDEDTGYLKKKTEKKKRRKKEKSWKNEKRNLRKEKEKMWSFD